MSRTYSAPHPIVFVFDFLNELMEVPEYDANSVTSANNSCVSVRTIADVDGDVTANLATDIPNDVTNAVKVFHGAIDSPNKKIALVTSENEKLLELGVSSIKAEIRIFVDDVKNPSRIWVAAK